MRSMFGVRRSKKFLLLKHRHQPVHGRFNRLIVGRRDLVARARDHGEKNPKAVEAYRRRQRLKTLKELEGLMEAEERGRAGDAK